MLPFLKRATSPVATKAVAAEEPEDYSRFVTKGVPPSDSEDLRRVLALPKREMPNAETLAQWADSLKTEFGRVNPNCECKSRFRRPCCSSLLPVQAWALTEARKTGGVLGPIKVGGGKSLLDILTPMVVGSKIAVLLLPPNLKHQMLAVDWEYYGQHWRLPNLAGSRFYTPGAPTLHVIAFTELSGAKSSDLLQKISPDTIIADEAHNLKNRKAARTKRFLRHFKAAPGTKFFCWSGTLTTKSIRDYAHLAQFSLKDGSPLPLHYSAVEEWAAHLDPVEFRAPIGALVKFGTSPDAREGFARRLRVTPGVITSGDTATCSASLICQERKVDVPEEITKRLKQLDADWERPDGGEAFTDALSVIRCANELSSGFFYRWIWPRGESKAVIDRWLEVRRNWHKELRERLKHAAVHMDSPLLCAKAAIRWHNGYTHIERDENGNETKRWQVPPKTKNSPLPVWDSEFWPEWVEVRDTAKPETEAVWVDDFLAQDAVEWSKKGPGLIWYDFRAFADRIRALDGGLVYCGPGKHGDERVAALRGDERAVISARSHGTGKNLQMFSSSLVANPAGNLEQLLGRLHRQGQIADEVTFDFYVHTESYRRSIDTARNRTDYAEKTLTSQMTVNLATWTF